MFYFKPFKKIQMKNISFTLFRVLKTVYLVVQFLFISAFLHSLLCLDVYGVLPKYTELRGLEQVLLYIYMVAVFVVVTYVVYEEQQKQVVIEREVAEVDSYSFYLLEKAYDLLQNQSNSDVSEDYKSFTKQIGNYIENAYASSEAQKD